MTVSLPSLLALLACEAPPVVDTRGDTAAESRVDSVGDSPNDTPRDTIPDVIPGETADTTPEHVPGDTSDPEVAIDAAYDAFFDPLVVQEVRIELSADAIDALNAWGSDYVEGAATINGERFDSVGVRLKGSSTYQDFSGKPAFKIRLNEYVSTQHYAGLERITLNNMISDPTQSKEVLVYQIWRDAGMSGPRASFARVYVNDELYGLYTNVESMDDRWLARYWEDPSGDLWGTARDSGDFSQYNVQCGWCGWVLKSGEGNTEALRAVKLALDDYAGDFESELGPYIDTRQFRQFWAWSAIVGNKDGYPFYYNDMIVYADPTDGLRFHFGPWGTDESYDTGIVWSYVAGRLGIACTSDPACVDAMYDEMAAALATYESIDVSALAESAWALSAEDVVADPRRPYTPADVEYYRAYLASLLPVWGDYVRAETGLP